jgi:fructoselysine-6-P-deglycase FrlB-like protein
MEHHLMKPLPNDYEATLSRAVAQAPLARQIADETAGQIDDVFLVGCGGSYCAGSVAHYLLETSCASISTFHMTSSEFVRRNPARLGSRSLVITGSHSGSTRETLDAVKLARSAGVARVVGLTKSPESELAAVVDNAFTYQSEKVVWQPKQMMLLQLCLALMAHAGSSATDVEAGFTALAALPEALPKGVAQQDDASHEIAERLQHHPVNYVLASGPNYGAAYGLAMCYLQEMQWMHAAAFNAGEFFHGAFEMATLEQPFLVMMGEDATRPECERAIGFLEQYSPHSETIDSRALGLPGVEDAQRGLVTPVLLMALVSRLAAHFEDVRGHDLDLRRYMGVVPY